MCNLSFKLSSGGWIRTNDLRVMSPTSYLCSTPHSIISLSKSSAKLLTFFHSTKLFYKFFYLLLITTLFHSHLHNRNKHLYRLIDKTNIVAKTAPETKK